MAEAEASVNDHLLYSWIDVQFALEQATSKRPPQWLRGFSVYTSGLLLQVEHHTSRTSVTNFLTDVFAGRYDPQAGLILPSAPGTTRIFPIELEEVDPDGQPIQNKTTSPTFRRLAALSDGWNSIDLPPPLPPGGPTLTAFYSFKGGVGRTTHLLGYLRAVSSRESPLQALVVDADLEAPGITSLLQREGSFSPPEFSLADLISVAQADTSDSFAETLALAVSLVKKQVLTLESGRGYADHFMLPAFRSENQLLRLDIRPEHLVSRPGKTWSLTELLIELGKCLNVSLVLVDLRAGFSELASPILLDPRVRRILVTTPSRQSIDGTTQVLRQLAKLAPPSEREDFRDPAVVVSFVLPELVGSEGLETLTTVLLDNYPVPEGDVILPRLNIEYSNFAQELLYVDSVSDAIRKLTGTGVERVMASIAEGDLPRAVKSSAEGVSTSSLAEIRDRLSKMAKELEYAETGEGQQFLKIAPLRAMARQFSDGVPVAVVVGSKGAGKTYTWLQLVRRQLWSVFVRAAGGKESADKGFIWPVLHSSNLKQPAITLVEQCRASTSSALGLTNTRGSLAIEDLVREGLQSPSDETFWRHYWFGLIAKSMGIKISTPSEAPGALIDHLRRQHKTAVIVFDGLEDIFPALESMPGQQVALRALLQGVPRYLQDVPECPLGIVIFVRADLAQAAIRQNYGQFARLYEPFALKWSEEEALRLAVWLSSISGVPLELPSGAAPAEVMTSQEAKDALVPLWGRKLGLDDSREARTAEWAIAALSDFRGQIQARDLVRFLRHAAASKRNASISDRVLAPRAIRDAILPCSEEKIAEIIQEIPALSDMFKRLQNSTDRRIPFDSASSGLTVEEIRFLQNVGVIIEDRGEFLMPEIFRLGLGFQLAKGKRPRVLSVARRVIG